MFSIPSEETAKSLNQCWRIAQGRDAFGIYWNHGGGKCRGIVKTVGLLPWPTMFPDNQSSVNLCLLENLAGKYTYSTNAYKSHLFKMIAKSHIRFKLNEKLFISRSKLATKRRD